MTTNQIFVATALVICGVFFGILMLVGLPQTIFEWAITDGVLAIILFISYLAIAKIKGSTKPRMR